VGLVAPGSGRRTRRVPPPWSLPSGLGQFEGVDTSVVVYSATREGSSCELVEGGPRASPGRIPGGPSKEAGTSRGTPPIGTGQGIRIGPGGGFPTRQKHEGPLAPDKCRGSPATARPLPSAGTSGGDNHQESRRPGGRISPARNLDRGGPPAHQPGGAHGPRQAQHRLRRHDSPPWTGRTPMHGSPPGRSGQALEDPGPGAARPSGRGWRTGMMEGGGKQMDLLQGGGSPGIVEGRHDPPRKAVHPARGGRTRPGVGKSLRLVVGCPRLARGISAPRPLGRHRRCAPSNGIRDDGLEHVSQGPSTRAPVDVRRRSPIPEVARPGL